MNYEGTVSIKAPWGFLPPNHTTLQFVEHCANQLTYFLEHDQSPNPELTVTDLGGYKEVLQTGSEDIAKAFFDAKWEAKDAGEPFKDNMEIVKHLKRIGAWK